MQNHFIRCIYIISALLLTTCAVYAQNKKLVLADSVSIKNWFFKNIQKIDSNYAVTTFEGKNYTIIMVPEFKKMGKINLDLYYPTGADMMYELKPIYPWELVKKEDPSTGFIYPGLSAAGNTQLKSKQDTVITTKIVWHALVVYGVTKKLMLPQMVNGFDIIIKQNGIKRALLTKLILCESYYDSIKKKEIYYVFLPKLLNNRKRYHIEIGEPGGDIGDYNGADIFSLAHLQNARWVSVSVSSFPTGCAVYKVPLSAYDLDNAFFEKLNEAKNNISALQLRELDENYLVSEGETDLTMNVKEVSYYIYIRKGKEISPPMLLKPKLNQPNIIRHNFNN